MPIGVFTPQRGQNYSPRNSLLGNSEYMVLWSVQITV